MWKNCLKSVRTVIYANAIKWREGGKYHNLFASERLQELHSKCVSVCL